MHLYLVRKNEAAFYGRELGCINTSVMVKHVPPYGLMDPYNPLDLSSSNQCLATTGVLLQKAGCCLQQGQAGLAGSPSGGGCLPNCKPLQTSHGYLAVATQCQARQHGASDKLSPNNEVFTNVHTLSLGLLKSVNSSVVLA